MSEHTSPLSLDGLDGTNPMGFLAGLGVLAVLDHLGYPARLSWSDSVVPRARIAGIGSIDAIVDEVVRDKDKFADSPLLDFPPGDPASEVKFACPQDVKRFLDHCRQSEPSASMSAALVCEGVVDNQKHAKPTDFHFTSGRQRFLDIARELQRHVTPGHVKNAIEGPWQYKQWKYRPGQHLKSFKWDSTDDRDYALSASKPSDENKPTVPGADWLAFRALALFPVLPGNDRSLTPGFGGRWIDGWFTWPLWRVPLSTPATRSLIQAVPRGEAIPGRFLSAAAAWGVHRLMRSRVTPAGKGYRTFRPSQVVWSSELEFRWPT
ncbi:hypothetical protein [Mycobacterium xenopi]|uniref:type I-G CRISPR-associated protein, Cas3-extension family n=1 Tax=Mycobacterium xenopi TaxID=1789 RepID=UPI0012F4CAAE|nr:hypothetical protein [Mycobacterium xenopi]